MRPVVAAPMVHRWQCARCTECCRAWRVDVAPAALREMALRCSEAGELDRTMRLMAEHPTERRLEGSCSLPMDGSTCIFLEGNCCSYRVRHGSSTLPASCTKFPHLGLLTPQRTLVGLSFACAAALQALVEETSVEISEQLAEPPDVALTDFRGSGLEGADPAATAFWDVHWEWLSFARRAEAPPALWLRELAERASGMDLSAPELDPAFAALTSWDRELGAPLLAAGAAEQVLAAVYDDPRTPHELPAPIAAAADEELLHRYLIHRLLVPEFLVSRASLGRLLGVLFAAVARYRVERARGRDAGQAVALVDRLILHSDYARRLFPEDVDESAAWPSLALLALAWPASAP